MEENLDVWASQLQPGTALEQILEALLTGAREAWRDEIEIDVDPDTPNWWFRFYGRDPRILVASVAVFVGQDPGGSVYLVTFRSGHPLFTPVGWHMHITAHRLVSAIDERPLEDEPAVQVFNAIDAWFDPRRIALP